MDTMQAYAMGEANRGKEEMVFDWEKAATIIKERNTKEAEAGLVPDWGCTGGTILEGGEPVKREDAYVFLASTWATPTLRIGEEMIPCYRMKKDTPGWGADTFWPDEALKILKED